MANQAQQPLRNACFIFVGVLVGALMATCSNPQSIEGRAVAKAAPTTVLPAPAFAGVGQVSMADVAQRAVPSVVNISATRVMKSGAPQHPFFEDPFFREFFRHRNPVPRDRQQRSLGSGVIVSADGVILTNNHVVEHAKDILVTLSDGRDIEAKVVGTDPKSDLAVLRLEGKHENLSPISFGASASLRLGDVVLAIGNPFGVGQTVTMGIVSAKGRSGVGIVDYEDFIQTDAAINPGNSGGALVNMRGELVGINTAILSRSGGYQGIGFAIPTDMAKPIMKSLLDHGEVSRGWLGVAIQDLTPDLAAGLGLSIKKGVLISSVVDGSPADKAGLERGDVVMKLNGKPVPSTHVFRNRIAVLGPDASAELSVLRDGKSRTMVAKLGSLAQSKVASADTRASGGLLEGVSVSNLSDELRRKFAVAKGVRDGVVVTGVDRDSRAARAGLRPGDVILELGRKRLRSVAEFKQAYKPKSTSLVLLVQRGDSTLYLALRG